ncbi:MAG: hypothetical protein ACRD5F_11305 [Candidatus Acidiferrales bacterium]
MFSFQLTFGFTAEAQTLPEKPQASQPAEMAAVPFDARTAHDATPPATIEPRLPERPRPKPSAILRGLTYATAVIDAESTTILRQRAEARGDLRFNETNPFARPFAGHRASMYAFSVGGAALTDMLGRRLAESRNPAVRRLRWLPNVVIIGANVWGIQKNVRELRKRGL